MLKVMMSRKGNPFYQKIGATSVKTPLVRAVINAHLQDYAILNPCLSKSHSNYFIFNMQSDSLSLVAFLQ